MKHTTTLKDLKRELKSVFRGYRHLTRAMRQELHRLGFTVRDDGAHYKVFFGRDDQHPVSLSRSASDWRAGEAIVQKLSRLMIQSGKLTFAEA